MSADMSAHVSAAHVWARGVQRGDDGALRVAGVDIRAIAAEHGTPAFVLDEDDFRARCRAWRKAFPDAEVFYAGKAFLATTIARWVAEEGLSLDVCTGGELATALRAGFPPERIGFHGNNKSVEELAMAVEARVGRVIVDSNEEIDRLARLAADAGIRQPVYVRVTVGVEAHTHEYVATAHEDQKFGFSLASGAALEAVRKILTAPSLELAGLHSHIGSQIFDTAGFEVAAHRVVAFAASVRDTHGVEMPVLNLGGGLGVAYTADDEPLDVEALATRLREVVARECGTAGIAVPRLAVEPGRSIVGPSTLTVYEVGTVKRVDVAEGVDRLYVSVDGGMSDNIRTALYGATYTAVVASRVSEAAPVRARVVGKHCETGDVVVKDVDLPADVAPGDLLAVPVTGAYCRSMASNYNHVPRPPVLAVRDGRVATVLRRETIDDMLALDVG